VATDQSSFGEVCRKDKIAGQLLVIHGMQEFSAKQ
jgi:hypothetical protein